MWWPYFKHNIFDAADRVPSPNVISSSQHTWSALLIFSVMLFIKALVPWPGAAAPELATLWLWHTIAEEGTYIATELAYVFLWEHHATRGFNTQVEVPASFKHLIVWLCTVYILYIYGSVWTTVGTTTRGLLWGLPTFSHIWRAWYKCLYRVALSSRRLRGCEELVICCSDLLAFF